MVMNPSGDGDSKEPAQPTWQALVALAAGAEGSSDTRLSIFALVVVILVLVGARGLGDSGQPPVCGAA